MSRCKRQEGRRETLHHINQLIGQRIEFAVLIKDDFFILQ